MHGSRSNCLVWYFKTTSLYGGSKESTSCERGDVPEHCSKGANGHEEGPAVDGYGSGPFEDTDLVENMQA
jgi:hypothetical protein